MLKRSRVNGYNISKLGQCLKNLYKYCEGKLVKKKRLKPK